MLINSQTLQDLRIMVNGAFTEGKTNAVSDAKRIASFIQSNSSRNIYPDLGQWPGFREWVGPRQFQDITNGNYAIDNKTYESSLEIKREDIEDDNLGMLQHLARAQGQACITHADELLFPLLLEGFTKNGHDNQVFFSETHAGPKGGTQSNLVGGSATNKAFLIDDKAMLLPLIFQTRRDYAVTSKFSLTDENVFNENVYQWGIDARVAAGFGAWQSAVGISAALDAASYAEARKLMASRTSVEGRPMRTMGRLLVVGPALETAARELLKADRTTGGKTNIWNGTAELLVVPGL